MTQGRNNPDGTYLKPKTIEQIDFPNNPLPYFPNDVQHATRWNLLIDAINAIRSDAVGEANTLSNRGLTGVGLVEPKVGVDLGARSVTAGTGISVTLDADNKTVVIANTLPETGDGGGSGFSYPAGLIADWDPNALRNTVASGSFSSLIPDTVGSYDATQDTDTQWPKFLKNILNGYPVVEFTSGRGDYLETDLIANPTLGTTQAFVIRRTGATVEHGIIVKYQVPPADSAADTNLNEQSASPGVLNFNGTATIGSPITDWARVIIAVDSAVSVRAYFNGALIDTFAPHAALNEVKGIAFGAGPVSGGTGTANYQFARGQWYDSALDSSDVTALDDELALQYGL